MSDFWSRRRRAVAEAEAAAEAEAVRAAEESSAEVEAAEIADLPEAEQLARLGLPDPDRIRSGDDVAAFMARAVPLALRNRALRSLWRSNPVLANLDGLNDYDTDFTGNGLGGGVLKTSYEVGRGLARHVERMAAEARTEMDSDEISQVNSPQTLEEKPLDPEASVVETSEDDAVPEEAAASSVMREDQPIRMRFTFEGDENE